MSETIDVSKKPAGAFRDALSAAEPGQRIIYHIGEHCDGAHRGDARAAYEAGMAILSTKRVGDGTFHYLAIRTTPKGGAK